MRLFLMEFNYDEKCMLFTIILETVGITDLKGCGALECSKP